MDPIKSQKIAALNQIKKTHYLIKLSQLLIPLSLCSFIFTPSSLLAFLHYFNSLPLQLFSHTIDKNCMFLLCNGLLVFVGITRSFSGSGGDDEPSKHIEDGSQYEFSDVEAKEPMLEKEAEVKIVESDELNTAAEQAVEFKYLKQEEEEKDIEKAIVEYEDQSEESDESITNEEKDPDEETAIADAEDGRESETDEFLIEENAQKDEDDVEVEEEENWTVSTEEMNKKFDDFIRKMKEDLRIEARQLVMV